MNQKSDLINRLANQLSYEHRVSPGPTGFSINIRHSVASKSSTEVTNAIVADRRLCTDLVSNLGCSVIEIQSFLSLNRFKALLDLIRLLRFRNSFHRASLVGQLLQIKLQNKVNK